MGCAQSRDEARKAAFSEDYNTVPYAYKACDNKSLEAFHPFDKFVSAYLGGSDKGFADAPFKSFDPKEKTWGDKDVFKTPATALFDSLKGLHAWAKTGVDADKPTGWGKYNSKQVLDALDATLTNIAGTFEELKWPEEAPADAPKDSEEPKPADPKPEEAEGGAHEFPEKLVQSFVEQDFFADLVKSAVVSSEIQPAFNFLTVDLSAGLIKSGNGAPEVKELGFAAAVIFFYVNSQETSDEDKEIWWTANFTDEDRDELYDVLADKDNKSLIFPHVITAYKEASVAQGKVKDAGADSKAKNKITFKYTNGKYFKHDDNSFLIARLIAKVASANEDKTEFTIEDAAALKFADVKAWADKVTPPAAS